jgi:methyl-accepting chemotaxis protein
LLLVVAACVIVVLLGVLAVNYFVQRRIKDRLLGLVDVYRDYAAGNRSARAVVNGDDEFAMLSMSLNTLLEGQSSGQGSVNFGTIGNDAAALQAQIEKLLQEVSAVGDGDLRVQAEVTPDTLGVLADSFNYMIEELAKVVGRVQNTAVQVTNATRRILDRSAELAQASETQVAQISQTTEAVEALAIFIQNVARNAQLSAEAAQEALRNANSGQHSVRQTIDGMMLIRENVQETSKKIKRLGERSNEIGEIVRIIEDIADQTNLLALNAAIQSAMAGEHGRGFAVVADEIRLLAERSTESTKRIDTLVKSIQGDTYEAVVAMEDSTQEVVKGSQLADEAGRALNSIYSAVERQAQMIENIARAANEQTSVSEAVAVAMGQISEITRQTNAGTQEASASVSYLAELSDQLRASVSTFRLPEQGNDMLSAFPGMAAVAELPSGSGNQFENDWGQTFAGNFPPLPEPSNSESLVALSSRSGQSPFQHQDFAGQPFGSQQGFGGHPPFSSQQGFSGQQPFGSQPGFGSHQSFGGPQSFGSQPGFGGQFDFGNQQGFDEPNNFDFNVQQTSGNQGQSAFPVPVSQPLNSPQQQGQFRQRRQGNPQQNQNPNAHPNQSQFGQDHVPFSNTGPFGS